MKNSLTRVLKGKVVVVGIGNILRADDGFGPYLVGLLQRNAERGMRGAGEGSSLKKENLLPNSEFRIPNLACIDAGTTPENQIGRILRENPDTIVFADAVHLGLAPGQWSLLAENDLLKRGFTTHDLSPHLLIEHLKSETRAAIYLLGVQPERTTFGEETSEPVRKAATELAEKFLCMKPTT